MSENLEDKLYTFVTDEEGEERACDRIPDEACEEVPGNFLKNVISGVCSKLAEQLASPGLILPWLLSAAGAPSFFSGSLVPVKDAGSLLPQLAISAKIRKLKIRKNAWGWAAVAQGLVLLLMALAVWNYEESTLGWIIMGLLLLFSIASGVASIAYKDVIGKTIPKGKRGQLLGLRASLGGAVTLIGGFVLYRHIDQTDDLSVYGYLILVAMIMWFLSAFFFFRIKESPGATSGGRSPLTEIKNGWVLLKKNKNLRLFIIVRSLLMAIPFSQPFLVLHGKDLLGKELNSLGLMVIAAGIASIVSSPFWGRFADYSSRKMMQWVAVLGIFIMFLALYIEPLTGDTLNMYIYAPVILLQVMAHGGARMSRKTYLVDFAPEDERPLYVSLSNTLIGVATLGFAALGLLSDVFSVVFMLYLMAGILLLAFFVSFRLKEVSNK